MDINQCMIIDYFIGYAKRCKPVKGIISNRILKALKAYLIVRANAVSFVIDGKGYLVTGEYGSLLSNYWIYDPATDLWEGEDLTAFEGSVRKNAVAFSTGTRGFVVTGQASSSYYDDTWELSPYEYEEE